MTQTGTRLHDWLARVAALAPVIADAVPAIEAARELPRSLVETLIEAGFFRLLQPASLGGAELDPMAFAAITAAFAAIDASTAWCLCQGNGCAMAAAFLSADAAAEIFGPPGGILAWGPIGPGRAVPVAGGFRLDGLFHFASGSRHATWLGAHVPLIDARGEAVRDAAGAALTRTMLFPRSAARIIDRWHVVGLRGTGSDSYGIEDLFIPAHHALSRETPGELREAGPLYRFTANQLYAAGFAGVALGIGRGMIEAVIALAGSGKTSRGAGRPMAENHVVQAQVARSEARLGAARAYLQAMLATAWDHASGQGAPDTRTTHSGAPDRQTINPGAPDRRTINPGAPDRQTINPGAPDRRDAAMIRLASTFAIHEAREVVHTLYHLAGATAIFEDQPFERRLRDINAVSQQAQGRQMHFETVGQILLGVPAENLF